jgi:1,4-dihydroxy-2-naphthoyl-CoA hydrolase
VTVAGITPKGWSVAMGIRITSSSVDEVTGEIDVDEIHKQSFGLVHGGVYCGFIESLASLGAYLVAKERGQRSVVGLENSTSFLHAVRSGTLRGVARPLSKGTSTQVWEVVLEDDRKMVVGVGRVRLLCVGDRS